MILKLSVPLLLILCTPIHCDDDCTSDEHILAHLESIKEDSSEKIQIKSDYKIDQWAHLHHGNRMETEGMFVVSWTNANLGFSQLNPCNKDIRIKKIPQNFWKPHINFPYSSEVFDHDKSYKLVINEDGKVTLSKRIKQLIPCHTNPDNYPFSNTTCTFEWKYTNIADYQRFEIENSTVEESVKNKYSGNLMLDEVKFALLDGEESQLVYLLSPNPQDVLINFFLPSLLFLIPPWLTLLLGPMAITRCCILMTSLILLAIHYHTAVPILLTTGGVNAIAVWKLFTYFYVVFIVIELILITLLASMGRSKTCCFAKRRSAKYEMEPLYEEMNDLRQRKTRKTRNCCRKAALFVDIASFLFFGAILVMFCYGYYSQRHAVVRMINEFEMESLYIF